MRLFTLGIVVALGLTIAGCSSGTSSNPNPPTPPTPPVPPSPNLAVTAPKDGTTVLGEPVTISISASNISDPTQLAVLLDGADITSRLSAADANGVRSVQVKQPDINYGKNQVQIRYQDSRANSTFTLDTASTGSPTPPPPGTGAELVPIVTRVLKQNADGTYADGTHATDWGIQVGGHYYQAPTPVDQNNHACTQQCYGYQILLLNRQDLTPILNNSNMSFEVANYAEIQPTSAFVQELSSLGQGNYDTPSIPNKEPAPTACQPVGCIMVMQSLARIGYNPCYNGSDPNNFAKCSPFVDDPNAVGTLVYWLTKLGASAQVLFANGMENSHVGYSFIGNAGSGKMPGQGAIGARDSQGNIIVSNTPTNNGQFERLGCLDTRYKNPATICDNLGAGGSADSAGGSTDLQQAGRISGVFIRDNYNLFTFAQNGPHLLYTFGTTVTNGSPTNVLSINGSTTEGAGQYSMSGLPPSSGGGFRLLILDRTHPDGANAKQWDKYYNLDPASMDALANDIVSFADANGLFFLASMGNISHNDEDSAFSPHWEALKDYITGIGGDEMTLRILGDNHPAFNKDGRDDYLLVGKQIPNAPPSFENFGAGHQSQFTAQEAGYVINRHTLANATSPTQVEGVLVMDHQGYYTPQVQGLQQGLVSKQITSLSSASLLPPSTWPYSGDDKSATSGQQGVYTWISSQLCCTDIRSTYINLNASPAVWLTQLDQLTYENTPEYGETNPAYTSSEFTDVKNQLGQEFAYLAVVRNLQNNILSLYQDQQSNVGLILDQAASDVKADVYVDSTTQTTPTPWNTLSTDVFPVLEGLASFAGPEGNVVKNALGIGTLVVNLAIQHSNDPSGNSQIMHALANEEVAEADLAQHAADEYTDSLVTLGNDFKRVVTDWGRLKTVGGPISTGQLVWDPSASGVFLRAFDLTTRRQFYPLLMHSNPDFFVTRIKYSDTQYYGRDDHTQLPHNNQCNQSSFHEAQDNPTNPGYDNAGEDLRGTAWWPGILQVSPGNSSDTHNPGAYWWDVWALGLGPGTDNRCPLPYWGTLPNTYGMFDPISNGDNYQTNGLGLWKPYILQYHWVPQVYFNEWYGGSVTP